MERTISLKYILMRGKNAKTGDISRSHVLSMHAGARAEDIQKTTLDNFWE